MHERPERKCLFWTARGIEEHLKAFVCRFYQSGIVAVQGLLILKQKLIEVRLSHPKADIGIAHLINRAATRRPKLNG